MKHKRVKTAVLLRYYAYVCKKLHIARNTLNESDIIKYKTIKMSLIFLDSPIYADYARNGMETIVDLPII